MHIPKDEENKHFKRVIFMCLTFIDFHFVWESSHYPQDPNKGELRSESRIAQTPTFFIKKKKKKKLEEMSIHCRKKNFLNP